MRTLPNVIDEINLDAIIGDLHLFLVAFPSSSWKKRPNDMPLRTVKTILHTLARLKGHHILNHLSKVTLPCEVEAYLRKVLDSCANNNTASSPDTNGIKENSPVEMRANKKDVCNLFSSISHMTTNLTFCLQPSKSSKRISKNMHDILAEIFKKIGSKENTREVCLYHHISARQSTSDFQGLNDLYDFKMKYPSADLDPFLTKCSQFFRDYIERGLSNIEMERGGKLKAYSSTPNSNASALPVHFHKQSSVSFSGYQ
jgi:cytoskeleton-associated protein 5